MTSHKTGLIRYAIYTRQSVDKGDEFTSCDVQFQTCQDSANAAGGSNMHWIGQRFDDHGYSGTTLDRPGMRKLRKLIDLGGINVLYAVAFDRLTRSMKDAVVLLDELEKAGVELRFVNQPELTTGPESRFLRHMLAAFGQFEREMIATRIAESRVYLKKHGRRLAGPPPYGYDADPITKQLVPNVQEARRVRAIFKRAATGQKPSEIAERINHLGWRTKERQSRRSGNVIGGSKWTARLVARLLRHPVYCGLFADGDSTRIGCHAAIIPKEMFDAAQAQLAGRRATSSLRRTPGYFPLRGKILCPRCGRPLSTYVITKRLRHGSRILRYYRCRSNSGGRRPCSGVSYPAAEVERFIRDQLAEEATWQQMLSQAGQTRPTARELAGLWRALGQRNQDDLMMSIIENVRFLEGNSRVSVNLSSCIISTLSSCGNTCYELRC